MTKKLLIFTALFIVLFGNTLQAQEATPYLFKYNMHQLFESYNNAQISITLKKYDIADIYLRHLQESISEAAQYIPERNKDNTELDKKQFKHRLEQLNLNVAALRGSVTKWGELKDSTQLSQDIFNTCVACHKESRLSYLFKGHSISSLFGEYMHKVSQHVDLAVISMERKEADLEENLKLISYYLDLLKDILPEAGPSGVVMDKKDFYNRLKGIREINEEMVKKARDNKPVDIELFRNSLNGFCVVCHEPERIK
ncbi:MAG: hypothetical protein HW415_1633 [Deltaproteobacteria bacterium]|nr:hypothetical protein [Deltaproteobacteria bacterium]